MNVAKIAAELHTEMNKLPNQNRIPVVIRHKTGRLNAQAVLDSSPTAKCEYKLFYGEAVEISAADIAMLSKHKNVERIWLDLPVKACLNSSVPKIQTPKVWAAGFKGTGIKVCVIDTGIDATHPDFAGRIKASKSFVGGSAKDDNGHGTHVAGTIAGSGAKSNGKYTGVAPEASLYIGKVLRADGGGSMSSVMAGIEWAVLEQKVQVINLSLGGVGPCNGTDALSTLCDEAVLQSGVIICVAAGNAGPGEKTVGSPGCARYVITVGAIYDNDKIASFSSRGPTSDGRIKPDIVFPGVDVIAPQAAGTALGKVITAGYITINGTSMATPHAAGVAALMLQANPNMTAKQVKTKMIAGAVNIGAMPNAQGIGRGDAYLSYLQAIKTKTGVPQPPPYAAPPPTPDPSPSSSPSPDPSQPSGCLNMLFGRR